jgi:hypothetical protein
MAKFQNILETVGNTPVVRINRLAPPGVNLFVKIEAFNPLGSVKDRLALGVIEAAEKSGELKPGQTVIGGQREDGGRICRCSRCHFFRDGHAVHYFRRRISIQPALR